MFELIEELKRVRQLAEQVDNEMLLYLLDIAVIEASAKVGVLNDNVAKAKKIREPLLHKSSRQRQRIGGDFLNLCRRESSDGGDSCPRRRLRSRSTWWS
jgi:hypothetical protein